MDILNTGGIYAFLFNIIVFLAYFTKSKINTRETKIYSLLLISSLVGTLLNVSAYYILDNFNNNFIMIAPKLYLFNLLLWGTLFSVYIANICLEKNNDKMLKWISYYYWFECLIAAIFILVLPLNVVKELEYLYTSGISQNILYILVGINAFISFVLIILNSKTLSFKKMIPVLTFIILCLIVFYIQFQNPDLFMVTLTITLTTTLMYHTIENPDVKLIRELNTARDSAIKSNNAKSDFLASMSHEIRTPLNAIVGLSECLKDKDVSLDIKEDLIDINNASQTLLEIVGNVLDINKIETNNVVINEDKYVLYDEINNIVKLNKTRIENKDLDIKLEIDSSVPYELIGDKTLLKSILNNLLSNAVKYTDKGLIEVIVNCIKDKATCDLIINVKDTGKGIKDIDKLFIKFERLDTEVNSTIEGTGLGLVITKNLVELLNGKINVTSKYGFGSEFMVKIPQKISLEVKPNNIITEEKIEIKKDFHGRKILIVDDNVMNIKVAKVMLKEFNFDIDEAFNGQQCLDIIHSGHNYDLILMDIMMPGMSGVDVLKELLLDDLFKTPVIALTADAVAGSEEKYIELGFIGYVSKPFSKEIITSKVKEIL